MRKLENIAKFYKPENDFDDKLIKYGFLTAKDFFGRGHFLELGCATGQSTIKLLGYANFLDVVEGSLTNIKRTQGKIKLLVKNNKQLQKKEINFFHCNWEDFNFSKNKYSDVLWFHGLEHVSSAKQILAKVRHGLAKGGRLHIIIPNANSFHRKLGVALGLLKNVNQLNERDKKVGHVIVYDFEKVSRLLKKNGFEICHWQGIFFKLFSNDTMMDLTKKIKWLDNALFDLGKDFSENGAELYICAKLDK